MRGEAMKATILGNGGAVSDGLAYNSFLIDGTFLVECPPDIMVNLYRERIRPSAISAIYLSHFHGDHCFGFPFLALRLFVDRSDRRVRIITPRGGAKVLAGLCALALGDIHPVLQWLDAHFEFVELAAGEKADACGGIRLETHQMEHFVETLGFTLGRDGQAVLTYLADTIWVPRLGACLNAGAHAVIADLNGEPGDNPVVHMSEQDAIEHILPLCPEGTVVYGTHLKMNKRSAHPAVRYPVPGEIIEI